MSGESAEGEKLALESAQIGREMPNKSVEGFGYFQLGQLLLQRESFAEAEEAFKTAISLGDEAKDVLLSAQAGARLAKIYYERSQIGQA